MRHLARSALTPVVAVVVAVAVGPMIVAVTLGLFALIGLIASGAAEVHTYANWYNAATFFLLLIALSYHSGWPIALSAGVLVAIWSIKRNVRLWVIIGAAGVASLGFELLANASDIWSGNWDIFKANLPVDCGLALWAAFWSWVIIARPLAHAFAKQQQANLLKSHEQM
jgi:hypothetical protein